MREYVSVARIWSVPLLMLGVATVAQGQAATEAGVQVLTRGPVHEAFAEASMTGAKAGVIIEKTPYDPITELPPDQRPEGANVAWIPGYWSWDDDRSDFIWVSGVWRDLPPGRQWVPGYWALAGGGSQWISGFWGDVAQTEVTYLPPPPEPLEAGPSSPPPAPDNLWTPGSWIWQQTRYDWQPGYWVMEQPDWVWSPAHYTWTPRGYVYVPGYWDHDIVHRGVMFAPVYYEQPVYRRPSYSYSPSIVIDLTAIVACLFVHPRSHQYYYGDYYDRRYEDRGFYPWYSKQAMRYGPDPIYMHYRSAQLRRDPHWDIHVDKQYKHRRDHVDARPPRTLALQVNSINNRRAGARENIIIGRSLNEAARSNTLPRRFTPVRMDERKEIEARGREVHKFQSERARIEAPTKAPGRSQRARTTAQPVRMQLPASPVAASPTENVTGVRTPPPMPVAPRPQTTEPTGRQDRPRKAEARSEAKRESSKGETPRPEARSQQPERKTQPHRTEPQEQKGNGKRRSGTEDSKHKKSRKK